MAKIIVSGIIEGIRYTTTCVNVMVGERRRGYTKPDGSIVPDDLLLWKCVFPVSQRGFISKFFSKGDFVDIYGIVLPYARNHNDDIAEGYSILGKNMEMATYQKKFVENERRLVRDSQSLAFEGTKPDVGRYMEEDF